MRAWWHKPGIPVAREAEGRRFQNKPAWASEGVPASLGNLASPYLRAKHDKKAGDLAQL